MRDSYSIISTCKLFRDSSVPSTSKNYQTGHNKGKNASREGARSLPGVRLRRERRHRTAGRRAKAAKGGKSPDLYIQEDGLFKQSWFMFMICATFGHKNLTMI